MTCQYTGQKMKFPYKFSIYSQWWIINLMILIWMQEISVSNSYIYIYIYIYIMIKVNESFWGVYLTLLLISQVRWIPSDKYCNMILGR